MPRTLRQIIKDSPEYDITSLAAALGVHRLTVQSWLADDPKTPTPAMLRKALDLLNATPDEQAAIACTFALGAPLSEESEPPAAA